MVDEIRAARLDMAARAAFAQNGERITETRGVIADIDLDAPPPASELDRRRESAARLKQAQRDGFVEVG